MAEDEPEKVPLGVDDLPDEVLLAVFGLLPVTELACAVSLVCRRWRQLSLDEVLWRRAAVTLLLPAALQEQPREQKQVVAARRAVALAPRLDLLRLDLRSVAGPCRANLERLPLEVRRLHLDLGQPLFRDAHRLLEKYADTLEELTVLAPPHAYFDEDHEKAKLFCLALGRCRALRAFRTDDCVVSHLSHLRRGGRGGRGGRGRSSGDSGSSGSGSSSDSSSGASSLRELVVGATGGSGDTAPFLVPLILAHAATLQFAELNGMPYASEMPALAGALAECAGLRRVVLRYCAGLARLEACPALRDVALIEHWQGERGFREALRLLGSDSCLRSVQSLTLYGRIPLDCDLRPLRGSAIQSLALHGDLAAGDLPERLRCLPGLERLVLGGSDPLQPRQVEAILASAPQLRHLQLEAGAQSTLSQSLETLQEKFADVKIVNVSKP